MMRRLMLIYMISLALSRQVTMRAFIEKQIFDIYMKLLLLLMP